MALADHGIAPLAHDEVVVHELHHLQPVDRAVRGQLEVYRHRSARLQERAHGVQARAGALREPIAAGELAALTGLGIHGLG